MNFVQYMYYDYIFVFRTIRNKNVYSTLNTKGIKLIYNIVAIHIYINRVHFIDNQIVFIKYERKAMFTTKMTYHAKLNYKTTFNNNTLVIRK